MKGESIAHLHSSPGGRANQKCRLRQAETLKAVCGATVGLIVSYLLLFLSDRLWDTPPWMRMIMLGAGLGTAIFQVIWWLKRRGLFSQRGENFAEYLQRHNCPHGKLVQESIATAWPRKDAAPLALAAAVLIILPEASRSTFLRWLLPMSQEPRFTFVQIDDLPKELVVAHGEPFPLRFGVVYRSFWQPKTATASFAGESSREATVTNGMAAFEFAGQTESRPLTLHLGDLSLRANVTPLPRPELTELAALVSLPPYLQRPPMAVPLQNGKLCVIEGSRIVLKGLASRSLKKAWLNGSTRISVASSMFLTEEISVSKDKDMTLTWEDWHGLKPQDPMQITVVAQSDQPPEIKVRNLGGQVAIQEDEVLNLELSAGDDYGLKDIGLSFEIYSITSAKKIAHRERTLRVKRGCPNVDSLALTFSFSPSELNIPPGSLVKVHATARDFLPQRKASVSKEHEILVLGEIEEAKPARKEFAKLAEKSVKPLKGKWVVRR